MNNNPKISVIVPIYGVETHIEQSLRSLLVQTKSECVEYIMVNDCTKDASMKIAERVISEFPHLAIRTIEHEHNRGVAATRQTGLNAAIGEYTIHFDPDDWVEPKMLEELYRCATENDADVVICDFYDVRDGKHMYNNQYSDDTSGSGIIHGLLNGKLFGPLWNKLIRRSLFTENNISFVENVNCTEDMTILCKVFLHNPKTVFLPQAYLHYIHRATSISRNHNNAKKNNIDTINSTLEIERYMRLHNRYEEFGLLLNRKKRIIKQSLLYQSNGETQQALINLFPEITSSIMGMSDCPIHWRIALFQASRGRLWIYNIIRMISKLFSNLYHKIGQLGVLALPTLRCILIVAASRYYY